MWEKFRTAAACSRHIYNGVILHVHPVRGESHNQRNTTIQKRLIGIQSDDEARAVFLTNEWYHFWIKCSERFPELWGKVKLLLLAFPTTYFAEQGFCQALHTRDERTVIFCDPDPVLIFYNSVHKVQVKSKTFEKRSLFTTKMFFPLTQSKSGPDPKF